MYGIMLDPLYTFPLIFTTAIHVNTLIPHFTVEETYSKGINDLPGTTANKQ